MILPNLQIKNFLQYQNKADQGARAGMDLKGRFWNVMVNMRKAVGVSGNNGIKKIQPESVKQSRGVDLIETLKKYLLSQDVSLDAKVAGEEAFEALAKLLADAGFGEERIAEFIESLKTVSGNKELKLSELFTSLSELEDMESCKDQENILAISSLPYIESILSLFGLEPGTIREVVGDATKEGKGIDTDRLVSNLKAIQSDFPKVFDSLPDGKAQSQILKMMNRLGLDASTTKNGQITLETFVSQLQAITASKSNGALSDRILAEDFNAFIAHILPKRDTGVSEKEANYFAKNVSIGSSDSKGTNFDYFYRAKGIHQKSAILEDGMNGAKNWAESSNAAKSREVLLKTEEVRISKTEKGDTFSLEGQIKEGKGVDTSAAGFGKINGGKTLPAYVMDQVGRQIVKSVKSGSNEVRLQLKPPSLGRLQLNIESSGEGIKVKIFAEQPATKEMLLSHAGEMKSSLMDQGLRVEKIDVQVSNDFNQSMTNARQESNKSYDQRHPDSRESGDLRAGVSMEDTPALARRSDGILDLVA